MLVLPIVIVDGVVEHLILKVSRVVPIGIIDGGVQLLKLSIAVADDDCEYTRRFAMMLRMVPIGSSNVSDPVEYFRSWVVVS